MADTRVWVVWQFRTRHQWAEVRCAPCGWRVVFPAESMEALFAGTLSVELAQKRFRCRRCGKRDARIRAIRPREYHG